MSLLFPIVLAIQTFIFVFYDEKCGCNKLILKLPGWDYNDPTIQILFDWMDDVTSLLDKSFAELRDLPYLSMVRQSNAIGWIEMRTYLYTKGLIIFSRQEIFVSSMLSLCLGLAVYLLYRAVDEVIKGNDPIYKSESANGIFFGFLVLCYAMLRLLRTVKIIERLQENKKHY